MKFGKKIHTAKKGPIQKIGPGEDGSQTFSARGLLGLWTLWYGFFWTWTKCLLDDLSPSSPSSAEVEPPMPSFSLECFSSVHIDNDGGGEVIGDDLLDKSSDESHLDGVWTEPIREVESKPVKPFAGRRVCWQVVDSSHEPIQEWRNI